MFSVHQKRKILKLCFDNSLSLSHLPSDDLVKLCLPPGTAATSSLQLEASSSPRRSPLPIARSPPSRPTHRADRRQRPLSKLSSTSSKPRPRARPPRLPHTANVRRRRRRVDLPPHSPTFPLLLLRYLSLSFNHILHLMNINTKSPTAQCSIYCSKHR